MTIDSHHHFWRYSPEEYGWINDAMSVIRRDFEPSHLETVIREAGIDGVVSVQANQTISETEQLLRYADEHAFIRGVVGWVPLASPEITSMLERYAAHPKLKGIRHVVQSEPAGFLEGSAFNAGIAQLKAHDLVYDILIFEHQLEEAIAFVDRYPEQVFVLDHIAKPRIKNNIFEPWATQMHELAKRKNVWCKVSGMVTEADFQDWTPEQLRPYFETTLEAFGANRLLFGSDWPVCLVACDYSGWIQLVRSWIAPLSKDEQNAIMGETAAYVYQLS